MATEPSGIDTLMAFRLAYLRAIAVYWRDPVAFTASLPPKNATTGRFDHHKRLEALCPPYKWVWSIDLELVTDEVIKWGEGGNAGWSGPPNQVVIHLPDPPGDEDDYTAALAAYYAAFPSFIGGGLHEDPSADSGGLVGPLPLGLGSLQSFQEFGAVVARALALCWSEPCPEPTGNGKIRAALVADGNAGLEQFLGYRLPWNMKIQFVRVAAVYTPPAAASDPGGESPGGWSGLPLNRLAMHLPQKPPDIPVKSFPVALAAYNNTGDAYPLTCGC